MLSRLARYLVPTLSLASLVMVFGAHRDAAAQERDWVTLCDGYGAHAFDDERAAVSLRSGQFLDRAVRYCREAVLQKPDNARLRFQLGAALVEQLDDEGVAHLQWAAARGYAAAQVMLGFVGLDDNLSTLTPDADPRESLSLMLAAADKGHLDAQLLASAYLARSGRRAEALDWALMAADQGHIGAQKRAAGMLLEVDRRD